MAQDRQLFTSRCTFNGEVVVDGGFAPNGSSAPTTVWGDVKSVAHTATGVWTITLADWLKGSAFGVLGFQVSKTIVTPTGLVVVGGAIDMTAPTVIIYSGTTATGSYVATDIAANAANKIFVRLVLKQKGLKDGCGLG